MRGQGIKYSSTERKVISKCIEKSPNNLQDAFREAGRLLNRSHMGISTYYYHNKSFFAKATPVTMSKTYVTNGKITKKSNPKFTSISSIIKYLFSK